MKGKQARKWFEDRAQKLREYRTQRDTAYATAVSMAEQSNAQIRAALQACGYSRQVIAGVIHQLGPR
jgi:Holliday junction resolvasome RuvABC DNA-binding subunit